MATQDSRDRTKSTRVLHVGGTAFGIWPVLAEALSASLASRATANRTTGGWSVALHDRPPTAIQAEEDDPSSRWLVFVGSPAMALRDAVVGQLQAGEAGALSLAAPAKALQTWRISAQRWLEHAQARRQRCLLADIEEVQANPDGLAAVLACWLDLAVDTLLLPSAPPVDPLLQLLSAAAVSEDRRAADLHAELQASCEPLPGQPDTSAARGTADALQRCVRLMMLETSKSARENEHAALLKNLHETRKALEQEIEHAQTASARVQLAERQLEEHLAELKIEVAAHRETRERLAATEQQYALMRAHLKQAQDELTTSVQREAQTNAHSSAMEVELQQARIEVTTILAAADREAVAHRSTHDKLILTRQEAALLLTQMLHFQEALEATSRREAVVEGRATVLQAEVLHSGHELAVARAAFEQEVMGHRLTQDTLSQSRHESAHLLTQLHHTQQRLESLLLLELHARERAASLENELAQLRADLGAQHYQQTESAMATKQAGAAARQQMSSLQQRVDALQERLRTSLQSQEALSLQLYNAAQTGATAETAGVTPAVNPAFLCAEVVHILQVRDTPPHRELLVELEQLNICGRAIPRLLAKLVEHQGLPGLALLGKPAGGMQALGQWRPTGTENGLDLVLLVPRDNLGLRRLEQLGASDWQTVLSLAQVLESAVTEARDTLAAHWPVVAARLRTQLLALRPRLRYDRLFTRVTNAAPLRLEIRLGGVLQGSRPLAPICLRWQPLAARDRLTWLLEPPGSTSAPLAVWPTLGDGTLAPEWPVPVGPGQGRMSRLRWWGNLVPCDRDLLLALMDTLLAAAEQVGAADSSVSVEQIRTAAVSLRKDARRTASVSRMSLAAYMAVRRPAAKC